MSVESKCLNLIDKINLNGGKKVKLLMKEMKSILLDRSKRGASTRSQVLKKVLPTILSELQVNLNDKVKVELIGFTSAVLKDNPECFPKIADSWTLMCSLSQGEAVKRKVASTLTNLEHHILIAMCKSISSKRKTGLGNGEITWNKLESLRELVLSWYEISEADHIRERSLRAAESAIMAFTKSSTISSLSSSSNKKTIFKIDLTHLLNTFQQDHVSWKKSVPDEESLKDRALDAMNFVRKVLGSAKSTQKMTCLAIEIMTRVAISRPQLSKSVVMPLLSFPKLIPKLENLSESDRDGVKDVLRRKLGRLVAYEIGDVDLLKSSMEILDASDLFKQALAEAKRRRDAIESSKDGIAFVKSNTAVEEEIRASKRRRLVNLEERSCMLPRANPSTTVLKMPDPKSVDLCRNEMHGVASVTILDTIFRYRNRLGGRPKPENAISTTQAELSILFKPVYDLRTNLRPPAKDTVQNDKAKRMMERMGWTSGSGLGSHLQGRTGPVEALGNETRVGLGFSSTTTTTTSSATTIPKLKFNNKLSKCTKDDQTRALNRLLRPVFELQGVIKKRKIQDNDDDDDENQQQQRRWYVSKPRQEQSLWSSLVTRVVMNVSKKDELENKVLEMDPSQRVTRNLCLSMLSSKLLDDVKILNKMISTTPSSSSHITHFVRSLPSIREEFQHRIEELVREKEFRHLGIEIMRDLVWCRPAVSSRCLDFMLSCTIEEKDEELRNEIITCLTENTFQMYTGRIENFAVENLKKNGWPLYAALCMKRPELISSSSSDQDRLLSNLFGSIESEEEREAFLKDLRNRMFFEGVTEEILRLMRAEKEEEKGDEEEEEKKDEEKKKSSAGSRLIELMLSPITIPTKIEERILICAVEALCSENKSEKLEPIDSWRETVVHLYEKTSNESFLVALAPLLSAEGLEKYISTMLNFVVKDKKKKKRTSSIKSFLSHVSGGSKGAVDLVCSLIRVDVDSKEKELFKTVCDTLKLCLKQFEPHIVGNALRRVIHNTKRELPLLLLRTILMFFKRHSNLKLQIVEMLRRLVDRQVWTRPRLWEGFKILLRILLPETCSVCVNLPFDRLELLETDDSQRDVLMEHLRNYVNSKQGSGETFSPDLLGWLGIDIAT